MSGSTEAYPGQETVRASGYRSALQQTSGAKAARTDRPMTEMENLTANLGDTYRRLGRLADSLESRINVFLQSPTSLGEAAAEPPAPQPGTLGALRWYHDRINNEATRLEKAIETLTGII